jgi:hypothetical protein
MGGLIWFITETRVSKKDNLFLYGLFSEVLIPG